LFLGVGDWAALLAFPGLGLTAVSCLAAELEQAKDTFVRFTTKHFYLKMAAGAILGHDCQQRLNRWFFQQ